MQESNKLTRKEFWGNTWERIPLPARYFYKEYPYQILSNTIGKFILPTYTSFLEIGGCPGRWSDYFHTRYKMICDSMDYHANNVSIIKENYRLLNIPGKPFLGDITEVDDKPKKQYDVVLSDGLLEHFVDSSLVFKNHAKFVRKGGVLIIGVPNIKKSWFYNLPSKMDGVGYAGYRHVDQKELLRYANENDLEVLFCGYVGVLNIGLVNTGPLGFLVQKAFVALHLVTSAFLRFFKIKKETSTFSPYIYLIAKKKYE